MKFSSAVTMTTVLSILSATQGAPLSSAQDAPSTAPVHGHYRRASSVSELAGRDYTGSDFMDGLNIAHEPGSHIKTLLNFVKRQLGGTSSSSLGGGSSLDGSSSTTQPEPNTPSDEKPEYANNGGSGLMGGGMSSPQDAGFAFEPGQGIRAT
ncbi:hypothetical protein ACLMJK_004772 [Lecanora helva]